MDRPPAPIPTPCVKVCVVDGASGLCLGCHRTLTEIAAWSRYAPEQREAILRDLPRRAAGAAPQESGG